jgi:hypothetical protein
MAELMRALELAMDGHGQVAAVVAEAGTGKSRLFHEFKAVLPAGCKLLEAYSVPYGRAAAWMPVLGLLRVYFRIQNTGESPVRREKVRAGLNALDPALGDTLPFLLRLLGISEMPDPVSQMDPQVRRRRTLDAIKRILLRESLAQPCSTCLPKASRARPCCCSSTIVLSIAMIGRARVITYRSGWIRSAPGILRQC